MVENKKGLSTIVVTLIIVLLSLVAVGVVWVVVRGLINTGTQGVEISSKCLGVTVEASKVNCSKVGPVNITCTVSLDRTGTGSDAIAGVKLVFRDTTTGVNSPLISQIGNIAPLVGLTVTKDTVVPIANTLHEVDVTAFFTDSSGNEQLCPETNPFTF